MKRKIWVKFGSILLSSIMMLSMIGCASKEEKQAKEIEAQKIVAAGTEINQNDYRGGYMRVQAITEKVISIVNNFNANQNKEIIQQNPSNYWNDSNFQFFANDFLKSDTFDQTRYFNEEETTWEDVETATQALFVDENGNPVDYAYDKYEVKKNAVNDYSLLYEFSGIPEYLESGFATTVPYDVRCTYNQSNDWLQMIKYAKANSLVDYDVIEEIVEYGRQKTTNSFIIQTSMERLYITYETLEGTQENEYNPLANAHVKSFAYSKLSGKRLPFFTEKEIEQIEEGTLVGGVESENIDEDGNVIYQYNLRDSIFPHLTDITADWVCEFPIEEGYYDNYIVFDGTDMTIYNQNHMSNQMEIIEFHSDGTIQDKTLTLQETLTPFTLNWVNEDGSLTGELELFVNESHDLTDETGEVLIPAEKALYNKDNRVIVDNAFLKKMGVIEEGSEVPSEAESEEPSEKASEKDSE